MRLPHCKKCIFDNNGCHSQSDPLTTYCITKQEHLAIVMDGVCKNYGITESVFKNALNGIDYQTLTENEIVDHGKWCSDNSAGLCV